VPHGAADTTNLGVGLAPVSDASRQSLTAALAWDKPTPPGYPTGHTHRSFRMSRTRAKSQRRLPLLVVVLLMATVPRAVDAETTPWDTYNETGLKAYKAGQYPEAELMWTIALKTADQFGPSDARLATSLNNLALVYDSQGKYDAAEPLYKRSLAIAEKALGPEHPGVATGLNNLAALYRAQGKYDAAEPLYKRSLAIREKALGPDHPDMATSLNNLAVLYDTRGKYDAAEPLYKRSLAIREKALGPDHPAVATSLENYASLLKATNRAAEAEPLLKRAEAIRKKLQH
jgi:tetratricopeptide (TPR) repeat protein